MHEEDKINKATDYIFIIMFIITISAMLIISKIYAYLSLNN